MFLNVICFRAFTCDKQRYLSQEAILLLIIKSQKALSINDKTLQLRLLPSLEVAGHGDLTLLALPL